MRDRADALSYHIVTQLREFEKGNHTTSRILKAYDDDSEHIGTLPFGTARLSSPLLTEQLINRAHHFFPHDGGPDTACSTQHLSAHDNSVYTSPFLSHIAQLLNLRIPQVPHYTHDKGGRQQYELTREGQIFSPPGDVR